MRFKNILQRQHIAKKRLKISCNFKSKMYPKTLNRIYVVLLNCEGTF